MRHIKQVVKYSLICLAITSNVATKSFDDYSNKTYLSTRPIIINAAIESTTWQNTIYKPHIPSIQTYFQASAFYQKSERSADLGKYFGIKDDSNKIYIDVTNASVTPAQIPDIDKNYIIHDWANVTKAGLKGNIELRPEQEIYGVRLDYFQDFTRPCKKLFFKASAPIVHMSNTMGMKITDEGKTLNTSLTNYFKGAEVEKSEGNDQSPLANAKIDGRQNVTGIADLSVGLGYKLYNDLKRHLYLNFDVIIPTSNRSHGTHLWQPIYGNGHHAGLGATLNTGIDFWENDHATLRFLFDLRYAYLFEDTEKRTVGLKNLPWGMYRLAGTPDQINKPLFPLANVLTRECKVKPGSLLDAMLNISFHCSKFSIDLGYNFFWKDGESVHFKDAFTDTYVIPQFDYKTTSYLNANTTKATITQDSLDFSSIATPALFTHKPFAGIGYTFNAYKSYPCSVGAGVSYELASSNADVENYTLWLKANVSF